MPSPSFARSGLPIRRWIAFWLTLNAKQHTIKSVIKSFRCAETGRLHRRQPSRRFQAIEHIARRKLRQLDSATELRDLAAPPGNRLEGLHGDRRGQNSIRINDQWRLCFVWREGNAYEVEIVDYH
jgi:proteic killer suppression protein